MESDLKLAQSQVGELAEQKRKLEEAALRQTEAIATLETEKTALADKARAFETFYAERDAVHYESLASNEQLQKELVDAQTSASVRAQYLEQAAERENTLAAERDGLQAQFLESAKQIDSLTEQVSTLLAAKAVAEKLSAELTDSSANLQHQLDEATAAIAERYNQAVGLQAQVESMVSEKEALETKLTEHASMLKESEARAVEATAAQAQLAEQVKQLEGEQRVLADQASGHQRERKKSERRADKAVAEQAKLTDKVKSLEDRFIAK